MRLRFELQASAVQVRDQQVNAAVGLSLFRIVEQVAPCSRPEVKCSGNRASKRSEGEKPSYILFMCFLSTYTLLLSPHTHALAQAQTHTNTHHVLKSGCCISQSSWGHPSPEERARMHKHMRPSTLNHIYKDILRFFRQISP